MAGMQLVRPAAEHLDSYVDALRRGWSPNTMRPEAAGEELAEIAADPARYLELCDDPAAAGPPITLADGSVVPRLPGLRRWMWDGDFAGAVSLRWASGTPELPPHVLGHVGYTVVPWKRRRGYATAALRQLLPLAADVGLPYVELTTDVDNVASQRVILANGGVLVERFVTPPSQGAHPALRFRIASPARVPA